MWAAVLQSLMSSMSELNRAGLELMIKNKEEMFVSAYKNKLSLCNTQRRRSEDTRFSHAADIRNTFDYLLSF